MILNVKRSKKLLSHKYVKPFYLLSAFLIFSSHDLYIKMETYFLQPNQEAKLSLFNGTFEESENTIARDRMLDASFVKNGKRVKIQDNAWLDQDSTITQLLFNTGEEGTTVIGVSTKEKTFEQSAAKFNSYLKHDGVLDMLDKRFNENTLHEDAIESYQKHVKAIYQVGEKKTDDWKVVLGYPIEFIPQENPYEKYRGETIDILLLLDGKPLVNQLIFANVKGKVHSHSHGSEHTHTHGQKLRTNQEGIVTVDLSEDGVYYLRSIYMKEVKGGRLSHESKWATLSFEVTHKHGTETHMHDQEHDHEEGLSTWKFILGSVIIIGILFIFFKNRD